MAKLIRVIPLICLFLFNSCDIKKINRIYFDIDRQAIVSCDGDLGYIEISSVDRSENYVLDCENKDSSVVVLPLHNISPDLFWKGQKDTMKLDSFIPSPNTEYIIKHLFRIEILPGIIHIKTDETGRVTWADITSCEQAKEFDKRKAKEKD